MAALKGTAFDAINDMLFKLYYLYEKSLKKCRELEEIITDMKSFITFDDAGSRPIRASGSRWVSHIVSAMRRILSKYGAYTNHLFEDSTVYEVQTGKNFVVIAFSGQMLSMCWVVLFSLMFSLHPVFFKRQ